MRSFSTTLLLLVGASVVSSAPAASPDQIDILDKRTGSNGCNADNLLRLLRGDTYLSQALPFCSDYLGLPKITTTVATVTPTVSVSETTTITKVDQVEETTTKTITFTEFQTNTLTSTTETTDTNTVTKTETLYTTITNQLKKRTGNTTPLPDRIATYPPSRISSACSCLTIPLGVSSVTYTAPTVTVTVSASETTTTTTTATETTETSKTVIEVTETITTTTKISEVDVTTTVTTVVTTTTNLPAVESFVLRSNGPGVSQHYLKAVVHATSGTVTHAIFVPNKADATVWFLDSSNRLSYKNTAQSNAVWVSFTVGAADPREILWNAPASASGPFLIWKKHANGNVVPDDATLDKLQSCVPVETGGTGDLTLFIGTFIDNQNGCKSVDLHPETPL